MEKVKGMHDVVVTGYGIISPLGNSIGDFERRMFAGESGITDIRGKLVGRNFAVPYAGVVDDRDLITAEKLGLPAEVSTKGFRFSILSAEQALNNLPEGLQLDGIIYGTAGGVYFELALKTFREFDPDTFHWERTCGEGGPELIARFCEERGHGKIPHDRIISVNTACAAGNQAIGTAYQFLKSGRWKRCLAGGADSGAWESHLMNFYLLGALTTADVPPHEASRPFSKDRSGFVKSEAAATLLMETRQSAEERGAKILAEVCGFGFTSDAYRLTDEREDGLCAIKAMNQAIETAGIEKNEVDYINAHGTSTPINDRMETIAIKKVFGDYAYKIPVSSLKSQYGHPTVAAGAVESIACILMLQRQKLAPTINLKVSDPECDLDYVPNESRDANVKYIMSNNFGFGGQNAILVFKRSE
jgi:3-oxoacyl-[acyl-carrier-protein] synthase II